MNILLLVVIALVVAFVVWRALFWYFQARKLQQSGYLPPEPSWIARLALLAATRLLGFLCVGPVKVIGRKNARYNGRLIIAPNHTFELDFAMTRRGVGRSFRFMTASSELTGLQGLLGAWTGAVPVNTAAEKGGEAAIRASVAALKASRNSWLLVFPQGKLVRDNVLRAEDFRTGVVRIARSTAEETGSPVAVLPVAIHYRRDPRDAHWSHFFLKRLRRAFKYTNYGAVVAVGKPIPVSELPQDAREATDLIRQRIQELLDRAKAA